MSPEKTARNVLCCDGCGHQIPKGNSYKLDGHGYLLCLHCAEKGDITRGVVV